MFEDEYIKDDTPSALIIMVLSINVKSRDLHMANFAWCSQNWLSIFHGIPALI